MSEEMFDIVDEDNNVIGVASRSQCHGDPSLIHRTAHVVVYNSNGSILLQKRSQSKDLLGGFWDTAVGGHLDMGESFEEGARREMNEELGIDKNYPMEFLCDWKIRNDVESENVRIYKVISEGPFAFDPNEIDEVRFWTRDELCDKDNHKDFTPNLIKEIEYLLGL